MKTALERFEDSYIVEPNSGCWIWLKQETTGGYAGFSFSWNPRKQGYGHIFSYELVFGLVPSGLELDHLCRIRLCVNPYHLEAVTHLENVRRSVRIIGVPTAEYRRNMTHCKRGHEFTIENTSWRSRYVNGLLTERRFRNCKTCLREKESLRQ